MNRRSVLKSGTMALGTLLMAGEPALAQDESVAEFYEGRDVRIVITGSLGGGFGAYSTILSEHLSRHMPGNPNFIVEPMQGAGGVRALNYISESAPQDGSVILMPPWEAIVFELFGHPEGRYSTADLNWIGRITNVENALMVHDHTGISTIEDAMGQDLVAGTQGPDDHWAIAAMLSNRLVGTSIRAIPGYEGSSDMLLAMEQGELDAFAPTWDYLTTRDPDGVLTPILGIGLERNPDYPNVPALGDYIEDEEMEAFMNIYSSQGFIGRAVVAPPGVPQERIDALRAALAATVEDPEYLAAMQSPANFSVNFLDGEATQERIRQILETSPELVQRSKEIYDELVAASSS